ncbi:hypothetical protein V5E97_21570 [Singulisphaera sp. Ch08]|uniref:PARG catalytic Macro domain-containing protein n=1 Tax=Singulisphaera sp. Ch08 TaxID=3120278 RepID=A0AAU7C6Z4_9BACT
MGGVVQFSLAPKAETARELCYRISTLCERNKRAAEALAYNSLVLSWPEITRLVREGTGKPRAEPSRANSIARKRRPPMSRQPEPIERQTFAIRELVEEHPPVWNDRNKQVVFAVACPPGSTRQGRLDYTRWGAMPFPAEGLDPAAAIDRMVARPGFYDYAREADLAGGLEWHVNFADPRLFFAYGSRLFAQDEMQAAEHPALGSLREALVASKRPALTVEGGRPTPVLVMGALRHCRVATDRNAAEGRPHGLYGNAFARADPDAVRRATTRIEPPTTTNLIAIAAPAGGVGRYRIDEIEGVLVTAYTAFRAAVLESARAHGSSSSEDDDGLVVVHTGFWGCGAFGGDRVLMTTLQVLAAAMAGVERIVFHTGDSGGNAAIRETRAIFDEGRLGGSVIDVGELIRRIEAIGFAWGTSDGN